MSMLNQTTAPTTARPRRSALSAIAIAAALMAPLPAAAEVDADGIVAEAQEMLDNFVKASEGALQPSGPITYVRDGDSVIITSPSIVLDSPPMRFDIPPALTRVREVDDNLIAFEVELPTEIVGKKVAPATPDELRLTIGAQKSVGTYRRDIQYYETIDMRLGDIRLTSGEGGFSLGDLTYAAKLIQNAPGDWSADGGYVMKNLIITDPDARPIVTIAEIGMGSDISQVDMPQYLAFYRRIMATVMPGGDFNEAKAEAEAQAAMLELIDKLPDMLDGASGSMLMQIAGLQVAMPHEPPFDLGAAAIAMNLKPSGANYDFGVGLSFDEPKVDPAALPAPPELMPQKLDAALALRKVPIAAVWQMIADPLREELKGDPSGAAAEQLEMAPMMAMGAAAEAGTFAEIEGLELVVGPATLNAKGVGPIMPGTPQPPLKVDVSIEGLDALVDVAQGLAPEMSQQITPLALMVRGLGQPKATNNEIVYEYLIQQGPKGPTDIQINGVSIGDIQPQ